MDRDRHCAAEQRRHCWSACHPSTGPYSVPYAQQFRSADSALSCGRWSGLSVVTLCAANAPFVCFLGHKSSVGFERQQRLTDIDIGRTVRLIRRWCCWRVLCHCSYGGGGG